MNITNKIETLLRQDESYRDDDRLLLCRIWYDKTIGRFSPKERQVIVRFLQLVKNKRLPSPETIRRTRQKVQEQNPQLRGKLFELRHSRGYQVRRSIPASTAQETEQIIEPPANWD